MSSRISKTLAEEIAVKMCSSKKTALDALKKTLARKAADRYISYLSKEVQEAFSNPKVKPYMRVNSLTTYGLGILRNNSLQDYDLQVPINGSVIGWGPELILTEKDQDLADEIVDYIKQRDSLKKIQNEIEQTLIVLGTFARVKAEFPEAATYLPGTVTAVTVSCKELRNLLVQEGISVSVPATLETEG